MTDPTVYAACKVALLTQHGKEKVLAPVLEPGLGCRIEHVTGFDTDQLGTFTREIPRHGTQIEAARRKARIGMDRSACGWGWPAKAPSALIRSPACCRGMSSICCGSTTSAALK